jgi:hypothetical protein
VPSEEKDTNGISRRDFATRLGVAAAGVALGGEFFRPAAYAASRSGRILGAASRSSRTSKSKRFATSTRTSRTRGFTTRSWSTRRRTSNRRSFRIFGASSTTRISTRSSSPSRTIGMHWPRFGVFRPASMFTSKNPPPTRSGKGARWSRRRKRMARSSRSER